MDEQTLQALLAEYELAEIRLTRLISAYIQLGLDDETIDNATYAGLKRKQIRQLAADIQKVLTQLATADDTVKKIIIDEYAKNAGIKPDGLIGTNKTALDTLLQDIQQKLTTSRLQILRTTTDDYRRIVSSTITQTVLGVDTRIEAARKSLNQFAEKGIVSFIDKSGKQWDIRSYSEMSTRTGALNALREGKFAQMQNKGADLIIVSSHPNPSPLCAPYERKILSISGDSSRYESLDSAKANGLFHANCKHTFTQYIPDVTTIGKPDAETNPDYDNYEATQDLRYAERKTREWKRRLEVAVTPQDKIKAKAKIDQWRSTAKDIADTNDLVYKANRLSNKAAR